MTEPHRIDVHHHIVPPKYLAEERDRILAAVSPHYAPVMASWTPRKALDALDRGKVQTAIISISTPGIWFGNIEQGRRLARECNEFAAGMAKQHKGRFGLFAAIPLPDIEGSLREIEYAMDELKADGIGLMTSYDNKWPGDPAFRAVFDEINRRKLAVHFHPTCCDVCAGLLPGISAATIEFFFDTTRAITSLLASGTFTRCSDIRFIFSHSGGVLPMLAHRVNSVMKARGDMAETIPHGSLYELKKLHYDIVNANPITFNAIRSLVGVERLLFGSDYPLWLPEDTSGPLSVLGLTESELRAIERDNALRLLPTVKQRLVK